MESINIADRDMLFWAGSPNRFNNSNSNDFIVNEDVIVKNFVNDYGYVIYSNISDDIIKSAMFISGICTLNIYNYKKVLNYLDINNIKYIYLEKTKIIFKFDCQDKTQFLFCKDIYTFYNVNHCKV